MITPDMLPERGFAETYDRLLLDAAIPGAVVSVDPETAEAMGAFVETAVSPEDAEQAMLDNLIDELIGEE